jgi:hypothetical protein
VKAADWRYEITDNLLDRRGQLTAATATLSRGADGQSGD